MLSITKHTYKLMLRILPMLTVLLVQISSNDIPLSFDKKFSNYAGKSHASLVHAGMSRGGVTLDFIDDDKQ